MTLKWMEQKPNEALITAATLGLVADAQQALSNGANVNCYSELGPYERVTPLMLGVKYGCGPMVRILLEAGANPNHRARSIVPGPSKESALHWAIREGNEKLCRLLLDAGAKVESESTWGSALQYAIESNNVRIVRTLLDAGASVNRPSGRDQYFPIHIAARAGNYGIIQLLLKSGAKLRAHPVSGETPLILAVLSKNPKAVNSLLRAGDDPEHRDKKQRRTPLMWSAWNGSEECARILLRHKVDLAKTDAGGKTALDLASNINASAVIYWIEKASAAASRSRKANAK